jgi:spore coat protein A
VPIVTHVHGAHTTEESDGYAEAWYLPPALNIPKQYATTGTLFRLLNLGPDEPFGGGEIGTDFDPSDPDSTGQVMEFRVSAGPVADPATPPEYLQLPAITSVGPVRNTRHLSLNEEAFEFGNFEGPVAALLGTWNPGTGQPTSLLWADPITENPAVGDVEEWAIYNVTEDAHPIHIHLVQFEVLGREAIGGGG